MKTKKSKIIFILTAAIVALMSIIILTIFILNKRDEKIKKNNKIEKITEIEDYWIKFQEDATYEERYEILSILVDGRKDYINNGGNDPDIMKEYNDAISEMKDYFSGGYNSYIENYRYKIQIEKLDKDSCNEYLEFLKNLKDTINKEKDVVFEDDVDLYDSYINQVDILISDLESKLDELTTTTEEVTTEESTTEEVTTEASTIANATTEAPTTTQAPQTTEAPATEASNNSNITDGITTPGGHVVPAGPAGNLFSSGRPWESSSWTYEDGTTLTTYFDNYGWAYFEDGSYAGYNVMDLY